MDAAMEQIQDLGRLAARAAARMADSIADSSAFGKRRAAAHSNEPHTVRDLLFPRQGNVTTPSSTPITSSSSTTSSLSSSIFSPSSSSSSSSTFISSTTSTTPSSTSSTTTDFTTTSTTSASSLPPSTTSVTSLITTTTNTANGASQTFVVTQTRSITNGASTTPSSTTSSSSSSSSGPSSLPSDQQGKNSHNSGGLSTGAKTAIAVVIPVVVVAALLVLGLWFWRRRKQRKSAEDERRKEMEDYGYNPNNDPTLPVGAAVGSEMTEDRSGYRGWGGTQATSTGRKASTTISGGLAGFSDTTSQPGGGPHSPNSPSMGDANSGDALTGGTRRETMESGDGVGALGAAPVAGAGRVQRGPSNASSSYSAGGGSHTSGEPPLPADNGYGDEYGHNGYYPHEQYDGGNGYGAQPVVRDVQARRNTRIENPTAKLQQGNSGIAQNF